LSDIVKLLAETAALAVAPAAVELELDIDVDADAVVEEELAVELPPADAGLTDATTDAARGLVAADAETGAEI
jgi:hypothetical protein